MTIQTHSAMTMLDSGASPPLPLINLGNHTLTMGFEATSGTREMQMLFRGAFVGYFEFQIFTTQQAGIEITVDVDGVAVVDQVGTTRPFTILGQPPDTQVLGNTFTQPLRIGYEQEWISDNVGFGGSNFVGANVYDWRFTLISGEPAQQESNSPDGVWVTIDATEVSFWRWDGIPPAEFTSTVQVDIRDGTNTIVATGTFTIQRNVLGNTPGFDRASYTAENVTVTPTDSLAQLTINTFGDILLIGNASEPNGVYFFGTGLNSADYDFRLDIITGGLSWGPSDPVNTWINGASSITWGEEETGIGIQTTTATLRMRPAGGGADIATALVTLQAESSP